MFNLLCTIPGVGAKTAWVMLVILGSRTFRSAPEVASFFGLNPIEKRSGKSQYRRPRLSKSGSGHNRQQLYFPAMVATRKNPDIKALYQRLLAADKTKYTVRISGAISTPRFPPLGIFRRLPLTLI